MQTLAQLRKAVPAEIRPAVEALYQELYREACEAHERPNAIRRRAWQFFTNNCPGYAPFWRHGFAKNWGKRVDDHDYTILPRYDLVHQTIALDFPEFAEDGGEDQLFDFLFSAYQPLPDRTEIYGRAWRQVEHDAAADAARAAVAFDFGANVDDEPF